MMKITTATRAMMMSQSRTFFHQRAFFREELQQQLGSKNASGPTSDLCFLKARDVEFRDSVRSTSSSMRSPRSSTFSATG